MSGGKHLALCLRLSLSFGAAVVLVAQTEHLTPFTGTWKMNVRKSRFNPGPPFKSFTITFTPDGTRHLNLISEDGRAMKASLPWSDGKEVPVTGMENAKAASKIQANIFHDIWKQNGKLIEDVHGVVSSDGKTLTTTVDGTDGQGHAFHNRLTFDKQ